MFVWDARKAARNLRDHRVSFEQAAIACRDPFAVDWIDTRHGYGEERCGLFGLYGRDLLYVAHTERGDTIGSSRPDGRTGMNKTDPFVGIHRDGTLHRVTPRGEEAPIPAPPPPLAPMTEAEVTAAGRRDPDTQFLTDDEFARMPRVPRAKTLRRSLALTQEEFAARFQIPVGTLRDWEQGRAEPDQTARAYLRAIAGDADAVWQALLATSVTPR